MSPPVSPGPFHKLLYGPTEEGLNISARLAQHEHELMRQDLEDPIWARLRTCKPHGNSQGAGALIICLQDGPMFRSPD